MNTDRIQQLQSLLDRIKRNAGRPKTPLGEGIVLGGTVPARSDVSAGPAVPVSAASAPLPTRTTKTTQPMQVVTLQPEIVSKPPAPVQAQAAAKPAQPAPAAKSAPTHAQPSAPQASAPMQPTPAATQTAPQQMRSIKMTQPMQLMQQPEPSPKPAPVTEAAPAKPAQPTPSVQSQARPSFWKSAQAAAQSDTPAQAGQNAATFSASVPSSPLVAVPSVSAAIGDGRKARARVPTVIGVAPDFGTSKQEPPQAEEESIEELDATEVLESQSSLPPAPKAAESESAEARKSNSDVDNLSWSEPPAVEIEIEEPPPDSSPRARVAGSIDEALAGVADESEPEPPVKTPPPESGRQPAEGVYAEPIKPNAAPTAEQLGDTLELEAPTVAELELDLSPASAAPAKEDLEVEIPKQGSVLEPPTPAEARRAREPSHVEIVPEETSAKAQPVAESPQLEPNVTRRASAEHAATVELLQAARAFAPRSFLELLDASLKLGDK